MTVYAAQLQPFSLSGPGALIGDTVLNLNSFLDINGNQITMANYFGTIGYGTIEPGNNANEEQISFTGITQNANGTATLTGVSSVLFNQPFTTTSNLTKTHAGNSTFIISDTSAFFGSYANKANNETITGTWLVNDPTGGKQVANYEWVLSVVNGGAVSFNAIIVAGTAAVNINKGQICYLNSSGTWALAKADSASTCLGVQLGICQANVLSSGTSTFLIAGIDGTQTGMSTGSTYYISSSTAGTLASSAGTISVDIGLALSATSLQVDPRFTTTFVTSTVSNAQTATKAAINTVPIAPASGTPNLDLTWIDATTGSVDQSQLTQNGTIATGQANLTTKNYLVAEKFVPTRQSISRVTLNKQADSGTFTGTVKVSLQADSAGSPSGSDLAAYTITNAVWVKLGAVNFTVQFSSEYETLTVGGSYWIVITTSTTDTTNHPNLGINTGGGYASGVLKTYNSTDGWSTVSTSILTFSTTDGLLGKLIQSDATTGLVPIPVRPYSLIAVDNTVANVTGTAAETTVFSTQLAGGFFNLNSGIKIRLFGLQAASGVDAKFVTIKVKYNGVDFGGADIASPATTTGNGIGTVGFTVEFFITNQSSLSSQVGLAVLISTPSILAGTPTAASLFLPVVYANGTSSVDTSEPGVLSIIYTNSSNGAETSTYEMCIIEKIG